MGLYLFCYIAKIVSVGGLIAWVEFSEGCFSTLALLWCASDLSDEYFRGKGSPDLSNRWSLSSTIRNVWPLLSIQYPSIEASLYGFYFMRSIRWGEPDGMHVI